MNILSSLRNYSVEFSLFVNESVCEGDGSVTACVQLETDIERSVEAFLETFDGFAKGFDRFNTAMCHMITFIWNRWIYSKDDCEIANFPSKLMHYTTCGLILKLILQIELACYAE